MVDKLSGPSEGRPVLTGIAALVGVGLVVGLVLGGAAWAGTRVLGLGEQPAATSATPDGGESLFLPKPVATESDDDPLITLAPDPGAASPSPTTGAEKKKKPSTAPPISLTVLQTTVGAMQQIDLTGVFPGGEGRILQIQRFESGSWSDFPATISVSDETFSTYVLTGQLGKNRFRVVDTDTGKASNEVTVTVR